MRGGGTPDKREKRAIYLRLQGGSWCRGGFIPPRKDRAGGMKPPLQRLPRVDARRPRRGAAGLSVKLIRGQAESTDDFK